MAEYHPLPQPDEIGIEDREDAMGGYFMMFAAMAAGLPLPLINMVAAVIYYYINKKKSRFVHFHSLQSLLSQLPTSLMNAVLVFWALRIWFTGWEYSSTFKGYVAVVIAANLSYIGFSIWAAIKARRGQMYYFLLFGRVAYHFAFLKKDGEDDNSAFVNQPPR